VPAGLLVELRRGQVDVVARDGFQLIQRPAAEPQAAPAHFGHHHAGGRHQRQDDQRGLVPHAAGRMLIHSVVGHFREIQHIAGMGHRQRQVDRLPAAHALQVDGHQPGSRLVIRQVVAGVGAHKPPDFLCGQLAAVALAGNHIHSPHGKPSSFPQTGPARLAASGGRLFGKGDFPV